MAEGRAGRGRPRRTTELRSRHTRRDALDQALHPHRMEMGDRGKLARDLRWLAYGLFALASLMGTSSVLWLLAGFGVIG